LVIELVEIHTQCQSVFANVKTVLASVGLVWTDLVDGTVHLTEMASNFERYNAIWAQYFVDDATCRTTLGINAPPTPIAIELKCVAQIRRT
jgi:2-aminomuconate deaminase